MLLSGRSGTTQNVYTANRRVGYQRGMCRHKAMPIKDPCFLYYPNEFSHAFEKYWGHLNCLDRHPGLAHESEYTRQCMTFFSQGISAMASQGTFELRPSAEAPEKAVPVAEHAAISQLRPIQDGPDCWEERRRCAATG
jgi:hypothetical protein